MLYAIGAILVAVGGGIVYVGTRRSGLKSEMSRLPTTDVAAIAGGGQVEIKGLVSCDAPLQVPHTNMDCVYYTYKLERRERSYSGSSGSRSRYRWVTIDSGTAGVPFVLTDKTGSITVDPFDATFDAPVVKKGPIGKANTANEPEGGLASMLGSLIAFASPQRVTAMAIVLNRPIYVLGSVLQDTASKPSIYKGVDTFFISTRSEEQISRSLVLQSVGFYIGGTVLLVAGLVLLGMVATGRV